MEQFYGKVYHVLKDSKYTLDVARIINATYHKRLFCVRDRNKPYTLSVSYHSPENNYLFPTSSSIVFKNRYSDKGELLKEMIEIDKKQNRLQEELSREPERTRLENIMRHSKTS